MVISEAFYRSFNDLSINYLLNSTFGTYFTRRDDKFITMLACTRFIEIQYIILLFDFGHCRVLLFLF